LIDFNINTGELATVGLQIKAIETRLKNQIQEAVEDGAEAAQQVMLQNVPIGETGALERSIHIDRSGVFFHAGGLGGGGYWESEVSAGRGVPHTKFVVEGTGIHAGRGNIEPRTASIMHWRSPVAYGDPKGVERGMKGDQHFAYKTKGQKKQDKWVIEAQEAAKATIAAKVAEIDRGR
jgi:Bacteriophage HK97-gp10, putative tail-component